MDYSAKDPIFKLTEPETKLKFECADKCKLCEKPNKKEPEFW
jgi:hypothetical protein